MSKSVSAERTLAARLSAFVAERFPFALDLVRDTLKACAAQSFAHAQKESDRIEALRAAFVRGLQSRRDAGDVDASELGETTPGVAAKHRLRQAHDELVEACDGFLRRESLKASFTRDERREMLRGMLLTRATDNRLKQFFTAGEIRYNDTAFQGKGFRSLGQEAIYAAAIRLRRGPAFRGDDGSWNGDVVAPVIRDLGVALAMRPGEDAGEMVRQALSAQMAKAGPPMDGKDFHVGDFAWGVLPATAPLSIGSLAIAGMAMSFWLRKSGRVAVSFIGEGGSSLGEWHEAINLCAARRLPAIFCLENNQRALSTPLADQSAVRVFADKAAGYGIPGITIDGTDPEEIAAAFAWAAERARAGSGPALIELVSMRMCGHAHHDDMLYLGKEPPIGWEYPPPSDQGYVNRESYGYWAARDPIASYAARLEREGVIEPGTLDTFKRDVQAIVDREAERVLAAPWPPAERAAEGVFAGEAPRLRVEILDPERRAPAAPLVPPVDPGPPFDRKGQTFLEAVTLGLRDVLAADPRVFVYGQDVGGDYGNAFLLLKPLLAEFGPRILNSPLAEGAVLGVAIGAALAGERPIAEMQFNDFVATGFNQLVNSAAKIRYRWGGSVPMVVRMPWGGLRHAGPYHSQNTEPWFYRTPGLKIVVPSTPADARALMAASVADPDPVLYYEHIALYRDPRIKQALPSDPPAPLPLGRAAFRRAGDDLVIISYGAYVHVALRVAERLAGEGISAGVLDLRTLVPLDRAAVLAAARHTGRALIVHEDSRTGGIGESLAALIQEEAFEWLDAPVRVVGALDTPVPYSPPLEAFFLPSEDEIARAATFLVRY
ncbi:MAG TPA: thiamine pyrophosphate-dependent enzyme [Vicinamibacterales bacterium]|jgi:2-oxoisovalerate dehydrogenase E1 component|nr:thiamine pyrophosphate-dependent enzyme [Vicinamibacterales bacterium]